ncbi:putative porin [Colwellia demingiae]|uniref:Putative porin n=1 Tax=Colwellia demingiae TaxID=89401 RepID=A0A5C6QI36_9GAMM|nr:putative porin [Colwellia demingiae]TWX68715.1 putative porin [Colwellia demingiae]
MKLSKLSKLSALVAMLLSNTVLAESYQSFTKLSYAHESYFAEAPDYGFYNKGDSDNFSLSSKYYFDERLALGPLNEFAYINTSSNVFASAVNRNRDGSSLIHGQDANFDSNATTYGIGGQWIVNSFIIGASYDYNESKGKWNDYNFDNDDSDVSLLIGYLFSDNFLISAGCEEDFDDICGYTASYNWQLTGTDYIGFSYNAGDNFDINRLSSQYFFGVGEQSYLMIGGEYLHDNRDYVFADDYWSVNGSYYYDTRTSIAAYFAEDDAYGISANYFINQNYSVQAGYNSVVNKKNKNEYEGYYFTVTAQF